MPKVLSSEFFTRPTLRVARDLLGKYLVRRVGRKTTARMITEVEAYIGHNDKASHASRGITPRNKIMFGEAGTWYVYFTYGMHWMLNIVTEREKYPAAVLIRGVEGVSGPARVSKFFKIDKRLNGKPASRRSGLWLEDRGVKIEPRSIKRGARIGIDYAGEWRNKMWRFYFAAPRSTKARSKNGGKAN